MVVNPFWLGVLVCLVAEIMLFIIAGIIHALRRDDEDIETKEIVLPPELEQKIIEEIERQTREQDDGK